MMNNYNIVLTTLLSRKVLAEAEMQRLVNVENLTVEQSVLVITEKLKEVVEIENMLLKWQQIHTKAQEVLKEQQERLAKAASLEQHIDNNGEVQ